MKTSDKRKLEKSYNQVLANLDTFAQSSLKTMRDKSRTVPTLITQKQRWDNEGGKVAEISSDSALASQIPEKDIHEHV